MIRGTLCFAWCAALGRGRGPSKEHVMSSPEERWMARRGCYYIDRDSTAHDLLNDATEWLQYARGLTELLADLVHESDAIDCRKMALSLEAIGAMTHMGVQCAAEAHARMSWEPVQAVSVPADVE
jgi:hypothetical protein